MAGSVANTQNQELEAHIQAYLRIFQAVLKKKQGDPARKKAVLQKLNAYMRKSVTDPDAIIDHIPQFSRALGVPEAALGNFIGANFLKALSQVKEELAAKETQAVASAQAAARESEVRKFDSILEEMSYRFGGLVEAPNNFEPIDDGLMKLVTPSGDVMPVSLSGGDASAAAGSGNGANGAAAATNGKAKPAASAPAGGGASGASGAPVAPPARQEKPLLDELLEKFGNTLDIPGKLEPSIFEEDQAEAGGAPAAQAPKEEGGEAVKPAPRPTEKPLLDELLEKFGNTLDIPGKLEPSVWEDDDSATIGGAPAGAPGAGAVGGDAAPPVPEAPAAPAFEPIPMSFGEYAAVQKKIQAFQTSGNQEGYRIWLAQQAGLSGKAIIGLRNLDMKARKGAQVNWSDEYYNLSTHLSVNPEQVEEFHRRMKQYMRIQQTINQLTKTIKSQGAEVLGAAQKIWPQVLQIFHQSGDAASYQSQFKIILLQVPNPALKEKLTQALGPVFKQVAGIYAESA